MITPVFTNIHEIRMGSPYDVCDLKLEGDWVPSLPSYEWQNIYARDEEGRFLALVAWGSAGGFIFTTFGYHKVDI